MKAQLSLKARALQLLAQREHSRLELRRKLLAHVTRQQSLAAKGGDPTEPAAAALFSRVAPPTAEAEAGVDALLDALAAEGQLSERRFVEGRIRVRAARHGNLRIRQELAQHGLQLAPDEAQALKDSELQRARQVQARKFGNLPGDAAGHARQARFLAGRGFSVDVIRRLLRGGDD